MDSLSFIAKAEAHLQHNKPFVVYRYPGEVTDKEFPVSGLFQKDKQVYTTTDFSQRGFVMAPFSDKQPPVFFPADKSEYTTTCLSPNPISTPLPSSDSQDALAKKRHLALVAKGIAAIKAHTLKKVVLSRSLVRTSPYKPLQLFQRLLRQYPKAFVYCWYHPAIGLWLGATPETLIEITGNHLQTMALAGTRAFQKNSPPVWTAKERAEQQFVTDYITAALKGKLTQLQAEPAQNSRAGHLWHLKSTISGQLKNRESLSAILTALHPTPAVCGLPKEKAHEFILENEGYDRSFYSGFLGELHRPGNLVPASADTLPGAPERTRLFVNLRCMQMKNRNCRLYVGGGIVKDSVPEQEWQETVHKSKTMASVL